MTVEKCPSCGSGNLYQFTATPKKASPPVSELPQVCRACSSILIEGKVVALPPEIAKSAVTMSELAEAEARSGAEELERTPEERISHWLKSFYKEAYLDGFWRSLAYWNHHGKEGRLVRMREIWNSGQSMAKLNALSVGNMMGRLMDPEAYTEFKQLLNLSPGAKDATSPENKHSPVPKSPA